jgi:hypothetical protein
MSDAHYRMYGLVPYNISEIQAGIQYGHAVVEYGLRCHIDPNFDNRYFDWATNDKTFIILNGGTTNTNPLSLGTLNMHLQTLMDNDIKVATFYEPDLGNQLTAVVFLVRDSLYDNLKNPFFVDLQRYQWGGTDNDFFLFNFLKQFKLR